jgi:type VI secretion system secreted protein VgrG
MVSHSAQGGRGANNAEGDSPWFPVVTQGSGNNFGQMWLPRVGSTVVLNFFNNDPDCPFVTGQMYDSSSHQPAQFSHKGSMPENRYMSGVVSKEIGGDRRNQIKIDDTSGQISTQISSDEGLSQANLGFLTTPRNGEAEARGLGLEIRTDHSGAIRAAKGLQISTHAQTDAKGQQMDASEAVSGLQSSHDQMQNLSDVAKHQNATPLETLANIQICIDALNATGDAKKAAAFKQAVLLLAGSDDIAITTPTNIHTHAGKSISQASGENTDVAVGKTYSLVAAKGLSLLSLDQGAKLFAAKGKVDIQAQSAGMDLFAAAGINITSTEDSIIISAAKKIILKADGSAIEIGGGIKLITRFGLDFKALQHTFLGPMGVNVSLPNLPSSFAGHFKFLNKSTGEEIPNQAYMITIPSGKNIYGHTGEDGKTHTRMTASAQQIKVQPLSSNLWHKSKNHLIDFDITADEENGESDEH